MGEACSHFLLKFGIAEIFDSAIAKRTENPKPKPSIAIVLR
jgi:hypothetical protein